MNKYKSIKDFLSDLDEDKKLQVLKLRKYILDAAPQLKEHIKWNAPSYILNDEDRITFNLMNKQNLVKLVLHMGATRKEDKMADPVMKDVTGLIEWVSDIRGYITFTDNQMVIDNEDNIKKILIKWVDTN